MLSHLKLPINSKEELKVTEFLPLDRQSKIKTKLEHLKTHIIKATKLDKQFEHKHNINRTKLQTEAKIFWNSTIELKHRKPPPLKLS